MSVFFDVLLDTEDLVVLGPPKSIDVSVDVGSQGERGAKIFVGAGNPNNPGVVPNIGDVLVGDFFINNSTAQDFSWLYTYVARPGQSGGANSWEKVLQLQPPVFAKNVQAVFDSGISQVQINLQDVVSDLSIVNADRYVVQIEPIYPDPVMVTLNSKSITFTSESNILIEQITNVVGNGTNIIYTTQNPHNFTTGQRVTITNISPSQYNFELATILSVPASNQFVIAGSTVSPYVSGGTARVVQNPSSLNLSLEAIEFSSFAGNWNNFSGVLDMGIFISVV
jgi:hypothetical protein